MSLVKSSEMFVGGEFPLAVERFVDRTLIQKEFHRHEYFEILFVEKGQLLNQFKNGRKVMMAGDLMIMKPYVLHVLSEKDPYSKIRAYCCSFLPQIVDSGIQSLEALEVSKSPNKYFFKSFFSLTEDDSSVVNLKVSEKQCGRLAGLFRKMRTNFSDQTDRERALTRCRFLDLLAFLTELYDRNLLLEMTMTMDLAVSVSRYHAGLQKALSYIHDHFSEPLVLDDVASISGASRTYFCRLFKHETGMTFLAYLNGLRIERAFLLLTGTCDNALDICYQVGFTDYTHFSRQFKKHTGLSPSEAKRRQERI